MDLYVYVQMQLALDLELKDVAKKVYHPYRLIIELFQSYRDLKRILITTCLKLDWTFLGVSQILSVITLDTYHVL